MSFDGRLTWHPTDADKRLAQAETRRRDHTTQEEFHDLTPDQQLHRISEAGRHIAETMRRSLDKLHSRKDPR